MVDIPTENIRLDTGERIVFPGEPLYTKLVLMAAPLLTSNAALEELASLRALKEKDWIDHLTWTVRDPRTRVVVRTFAPGDVRILSTKRTENVPNHSPHAPDPDQGKPGHDNVLFEGRVELPALPPGDYLIEAGIGSLLSTNYVLVRRGDETPLIRWVYLARLMKRPTSWEEYKRLQLERFDLLPDKASPLIDLGYRALQDGTLAEAAGYFDRAIVVLETNRRRYREEHPRRSVAGFDWNIQRYREISSLLPDFFARRGEVQLTQESATEHWVLTETKTGRVVRVGDSTVKR